MQEVRRKMDATEEEPGAVSTVQKFELEIGFVSALVQTTRHNARLDNARHDATGLRQSR